MIPRYNLERMKLILDSMAKDYQSKAMEAITQWTDEYGLEPEDIRELSDYLLVRRIKRHEQTPD